MLLDAELRADVDASGNRLPAKVGAAVTRKIPLIVVVGRREAEQRTVAVRYRFGREAPMWLDQFVVHAAGLVLPADGVRRLGCRAAECGGGLAVGGCGGGGGVFRWGRSRAVG
jgi:Anticodon binding domain